MLVALLIAPCFAATPEPSATADGLLRGLVGGAAYGTVLSQALGLTYLIARINTGSVAGLRIRLRPVSLDRAVVSELWSVGWPAALDMVILNVGFMAVVGFVGSTIRV